MGAHAVSEKCIKPQILHHKFWQCQYYPDDDPFHFKTNTVDSAANTAEIVGGTSLSATAVLIVSAIASAVIYHFRTGIMKKINCSGSGSTNDGDGRYI